MGEKQHDRGFEANGLKDFVEGSLYIVACRFTPEDVEASCGEIFYLTDD